MDKDLLSKASISPNEFLMFSDQGDKKPNDGDQKVPPGFEKFLKRKNKEVPEEKKEPSKEEQAAS